MRAAPASDPALQGAWDTLLAHVRKRVLLDDYNMDPKLMYEYTRDYGPIDWRHAQAHALYWSLKGTEHGEDRVAVTHQQRTISSSETSMCCHRTIRRSLRTGSAIG